MKKILSSKCFVILTPLLTLIMGLGAGWLLSYQSPMRFNRPSDDLIGSTLADEYVFQIRVAFGYWLLALIFSLIVLLLCILIKKQYSERK